MNTTNTTNTTKVAILELPTLAEIKESRKGKAKKTGIMVLTGHNLFVGAWSRKFKAGFPKKGVWEEQNKEAWNQLATAYNAQL